MSLVAELREAKTLTLFLEGPPLTRNEPLRGKKGMYAHPKTAAGLLAWQYVWAAAGRLRVGGPVMLEVYVRVKRPASHKTKSGSLNAEGRKYPIPPGFDLSNVVKLVEDALKHHAFGDDSQVVVLHVRKTWAGLQPVGTEVTISQYALGV